MKRNSAELDRRDSYEDGKTEGKIEGKAEALLAF